MKNNENSQHMDKHLIILAVSIIMVALGEVKILRSLHVFRGNKVKS
jgi:uncharacterized membrane protein YkgB